MRILHLNLKKKYFDQIKSREKEYEYRLVTEYWTKRLQFQVYDYIILKCGYPPKTDKSRHLERPWDGAFVKSISHPEFGGKTQLCYWIKVN